MLFLGVKGQEKRPEILEISGLGGDKRDRTDDLLNAIQALSQLSYAPIYMLRNEVLRNGVAFGKLL